MVDELSTTEDAEEMRKNPYDPTAVSTVSSVVESCYHSTSGTPAL